MTAPEVDAPPHYGIVTQVGSAGVMNWRARTNHSPDGTSRISIVYRHALVSMQPEIASVKGSTSNQMSPWRTSGLFTWQMSYPVVKIFATDANHAAFVHLKLKVRWVRDVAWGHNFHGHGERLTYRIPGKHLADQELTGLLP
jgi:hypothetical protein